MQGWPKDLFNAFNDNPIHRFKTVLKEHCEVDFWANSAFYSYKFLKPRDEDKGAGIHQCVLKVQKAHRAALLSFSGKCEIMIRDYVPKGVTIQDLSVLPRYWTTPKKQDRTYCVRLASSLVTLGSPPCVEAWRHALKSSLWAPQEKHCSLKMTD